LLHSSLVETFLDRFIELCEQPLAASPIAGAHAGKKNSALILLTKRRNWDVFTRKLNEKPISTPRRTDISTNNLNIRSASKRMVARSSQNRSTVL
jgi:hypothetical protein